MPQPEPAHRLVVNRAWTRNRLSCHCPLSSWEHDPTIDGLPRFTHRAYGCEPADDGPYVKFSDVSSMLDRVREDMRAVAQAVAEEREGMWDEMLRRFKENRKDIIEDCLRELHKTHRIDRNSGSMERCLYCGVPYPCQPISVLQTFAQDQTPTRTASEDGPAA